MHILRQLSIHDAGLQHVVGVVGTYVQPPALPPPAGNLRRLALRFVPAQVHRVLVCDSPATPYYKECYKGDELGAHPLADCWRKGMPPGVYREEHRPRTVASWRAVMRRSA